MIRLDMLIEITRYYTGTLDMATNFQIALVRRNNNQPEENVTEQ